MEFYRADSVMASMTLHILKKNSTEYEPHFEYAAEKFTKDTVKRMAKVYSRIAAGLCDAEKLGEINLVSDEALMLMDDANIYEAGLSSIGAIRLKGTSKNRFEKRK